jgi:hypothetical protein
VTHVRQITPGYRRYMKVRRGSSISLLLVDQDKLFELAA